MPTYCAKSKHPKDRPWVARVTVRGSKYNLGYFATCKEAEWHEQEFRITMTGKALNVSVSPAWTLRNTPPEGDNAV